jgi:hypothetical protein
LLGAYLAYENGKRKPRELLEQKRSHEPSAQEDKSSWGTKKIKPSVILFFKKENNTNTHINANADANANANADANAKNENVVTNFGPTL